MLGIIGFDNLKIRCIIGELPEERDWEQTIFVSIRVKTDFSKCVQSDDLIDAVDYVSLADTCSNVARKGNYFLIETYASRVLDALLESFPLQSAHIVVKKPKGLESADHSIVELEKIKV